VALVYEDCKIVLNIECFTMEMFYSKWYVVVIQRIISNFR
jgi:hypothetical protein